MRCSPADSAALLVVFLPDRVLALARHLQNTVSNIDWLHSRGPFPAQLRNCSWPIQGHDGVLSVNVLPQPDICSAWMAVCLAACGEDLPEPSWFLQRGMCKALCVRQPGVSGHLGACCAQSRLLHGQPALRQAAPGLEQNHNVQACRCPNCDVCDMLSMSRQEWQDSKTGCPWPFSRSSAYQRATPMPPSRQAPVSPGHSVACTAHLAPKRTSLNKADVQPGELTVRACPLQLVLDH